LSFSANREMAPVGRAGVLQLSCGTGEQFQSRALSQPGDPSLAVVVAPPERPAPTELVAFRASRREVAPGTAHPFRIHKFALTPPTSKVRAVCA